MKTFDVTFTRKRTGSTMTHKMAIYDNPYCWSAEMMADIWIRSVCGPNLSDDWLVTSVKEKVE